MKQLAIFETQQFARSEGNSSVTPTKEPRAEESKTHKTGASWGVEVLLSSQEAAEVLKIHPKVLERMAKRGEVPALKVGKFWRYSPSALDAWINSRLQSSRQPCRMKTSF